MINKSFLVDFTAEVYLPFFLIYIPGIYISIFAGPVKSV